MCSCICTNLNHKAIHARSLRIVKNLQNRIFRAIKTGNLKQAKNLQKLLMRSQSNSILASNNILLQTKNNAQEKTIFQNPNVDNANPNMDFAKDENKTITSPHSCLEKIKEFCEENKATRAITFSLQVYTPSKFQKYLLRKLSFSSYKRQLDKLLNAKHHSDTNLPIVFYGQKISSKDVLWQQLGKDILQINDSFCDTSIFYNSGHVVILGNCYTKMTSVVKKLYLLLEKVGIAITNKQESLIENGFEFIGFRLNRKDKHLQIQVSKYEIQKHLNHLKKLWKWAKGKDIDAVVLKVNTVIKKWCSYVCYHSDLKFLKKMQSYQLKKQQKWALSSHPNKSKKWVFGKYFQSNDKKWVFGVETSMYSYLDFRL